MTAKILIVDDHDVVRQGARAILQKARPEWEICGEATTGREAIGAVARLHPDVVILDISMPDMTGIEATPEIAHLAPECRILLFTMHESEALLDEAKRLGAQGYVQKTQAGRDLVRAVDRLLAGDTFFGSHNKPRVGSAGEAEGGTPNPGVSNRSALNKEQQLDGFTSVDQHISAGNRPGNFVSFKEDLAVSLPGRAFAKGAIELISQHLKVVRFWLSSCTLLGG